MRIISQNGEVDFPYEQFVVAIDATTKTSILAFPASVADDTYFNLAEYSTKEKAAKAMEMPKKYISSRKQRAIQLKRQCKKTGRRLCMEI